MIEWSVSGEEGSAVRKSESCSWSMTRGGLGPTDISIFINVIPCDIKTGAPPKKKRPCSIHHTHNDQLAYGC